MRAVKRENLFISLIKFVFFAFLSCFPALFLSVPSVFGDDRPPAVPVIEVEQEKLAAPVVKSPSPGPETDDSSSSPPTATETKPETLQKPADAHSPELSLVGKPKQDLVVVELFSSQACSFCPKADALLGELARVPWIIALSCHVDYFDVKTGSLSLPFCSSQQTEYESTLRAGPKYTPQMVVNGQYDVVGYKRDDVVTTIKRARREQSLVRLSLEKEAGGTTFELRLPDMRSGEKVTTQHAVEEKSAQPFLDYQIYVLVYDIPHEIMVADGANAGKTLIYTNIVRNVGVLGPWDGTPETLRFDPKLTALSAGFTVLVRSKRSGNILAVGRYDKANFSSAP